MVGGLGRPYRAPEFRSGIVPRAYSPGYHIAAFQAWVITLRPFSLGYHIAAFRPGITLPAFGPGYRIAALQA